MRWQAYSLSKILISSIILCNFLSVLLVLQHTQYHIVHLVLVLLYKRSKSIHAVVKVEHVWGSVDWVNLTYMGLDDGGKENLRKMLEKITH